MRATVFLSDLKTGAQIDLLFCRADNVLTLCEIKHKKDVTSEVIAQVEKKVDILLNSPLNKGRGFTIEKILFTAYPPAATVSGEGYFSKIVTLEKLYDYL